MPEEQCNVGPLTPLSTTLQQRYNQLQAPQCNNRTYIKTFFHKMLSFINDDEIIDILCHLSEAASNLNHIHVSPKETICSCFTWTLWFCSLTWLDLSVQHSNVMNIYKYMIIWKKHIMFPLQSACIVYSSLLTVTSDHYWVVKKLMAYSLLVI